MYNVHRIRIFIDRWGVHIKHYDTEFEDTCGVVHSYDSRIYIVYTHGVVWTARLYIGTHINCLVHHPIRTQYIHVYTFREYNVAIAYKSEYIGTLAHPV